LVLHWDTHGISRGSYAMSASASIVPGETSVENNHFVDGIVELTEAPAGTFLPDWLYLFFPTFLALLIILVVLSFYHKRRKEKAENSFYEGWIAWYYSYDVRNKKRKA
jgi:hypothetical protein